MLLELDFKFTADEFPGVIVVAGTVAFSLTSCVTLRVPETSTSFTGSTTLYFRYFMNVTSVDGCGVVVEFPRRVPLDDVAVRLELLVTGKPYFWSSSPGRLDSVAALGGNLDVEKLLGSVEVSIRSDVLVVIFEAVTAIDFVTLELKTLLKFSVLSFLGPFVAETANPFKQFSKVLSR